MMVNGTRYTVTVQEGTLADGTPFTKVFSTGPDGVPDPYVMVTRTYLTIPILWWTVTYGEDDWLYEQFLTNAGGVNEAMAFKTNVNQNLIGVGVLGGSSAPSRLRSYPSSQARFFRPACWSQRLIPTPWQR